MSKINDTNSNNTTTDSEHSQELQEHYSEALEEKQEDSLKGTPKESQKKQEKKKKADKNPKTSKNPEGETEEDFLYETHIQNEDDDLEEEELDDFGNVIGYRSKNSGSAGGRKRMLKKGKTSDGLINSDLDDEHEERLKRKKTKRADGRKHIDDDDDDEDDLETNINFSNQSDDDDDDDNQNDETINQYSAMEKGNLQESSGSFSDNKQDYMNFLSDFIHNIATLNPADLAQQKAMTQDIIMQMFNQFIEGMQQFDKDTKQHHVFGRGARLTQEILRNLKANDMVSAQMLIEKIIVKK
ncbi:MAG: hypothetical protein ACJARD_000185 [Alphaproteobacteria bacterium]|jgi:hypothetical protein